MTAQTIEGRFGLKARGGAQRMETLMIPDGTPRIRRTFAGAWRVLAALFVWDVAVTVFYLTSPYKAPSLPVTLFGTGLALFLGFRVNSAYQRWWEGRVLWGAMINASRSLARAIVAFLGDGDPRSDAIRRSIVVRQVAYAHALRRQLRRQDPKPDVRRLLDPDEADDALRRQNPANGLLDGIGAMVAQSAREQRIDTIQQAQLERVLIDIANAQGGMERIKNTPLPAQYRSFPEFFTRLFCCLLPVGLVDTLGWATPVGSTVISLMFLAVLRIGDDLVDPFANTVHDVPMTAMCQTIEIDLLEAIGAPAPEPLKPVDGVLW
uniref:bestrophin family protein n=1 Tax=uncultured Caulobacter sp. TaxID=158749 RepID=UPI0025E995FA|nr:bestrophin family ion channel [uncultured Caulobacter sp.]